MDYRTVWNALLNLSNDTLFYPNQRETYEKYLEAIGWVKRKPMRNDNNKTYEVRNFPAKPRGALHNSNGRSPNCDCQW